jgi:hypothetical protein
MLQNVAQAKEHHPMLKSAARSIHNVRAGRFSVQVLSETYPRFRRDEISGDALQRSSAEGLVH